MQLVGSYETQIDKSQSNAFSMALSQIFLIYNELILAEIQLQCLLSLEIIKIDKSIRMKKQLHHR